MRKGFIEALGVVFNSLLLVAPMVAATPAPPKAVDKTAQTKHGIRAVWPPETLSGSIMMVDPAKKLLIVTGPDGVPFDMVVTRSTRIESGSQRLVLDQLSTDNGKQVSVRFVPERSGDIARTIRVGG